MAPALPLFLAALAAEPPRTVNDQAFGKAEDFMTRGPARVCMRGTSIDVERGETAYLDYLGIHWGGVRVEGPRGTFRVADGEIWVEPPWASSWDMDRSGREIARGSPDGRLTYMIYAPTGAAKPKPRVRLEGDALGRSTARDEAILDRITVSRGEPRGCARRYEYGWGVLLGEPE